jgi:hypothetical protein
VARPDGSLVVLREGVGQVAGLARRQIAVANRRYYQSSDHGVSIHYGLLNRGRVSSVGDIQFRGDELVSQYHKTVTLRRMMQDLEQLRLAVADGAKHQTLDRPNLGVILPITLRVSAILPRSAREGRAGDRGTPVALLAGRCFVCTGTEHVSRVAQKRVAGAIAQYTEGIEQSIIPNDHGDGLIWGQSVGKTGLANQSRIIRPLVAVSDKVRQRHPLDDKPIRSAGASSGDIDPDV